MSKVSIIYQKLFSLYGPQGWWPLQELNNKTSINITKSGSLHRYHPGEYEYPKTKDQIFEICLGAILTQNTAWDNVDKALQNLKRSNALSLKGIKQLSTAKLKELIKPAGYFNQKASYIQNFIKFFEKQDGILSRHELLEVKGIGDETADSILLYAYKTPEFVVDAYTRRIFSHLGFFDQKATYQEIKQLFESNLKKDPITFQEYHALIVEHAKRYYNRKPYKECPLKSLVLNKK